MKQILKHVSVMAMSFAVSTPVLAAVILPTAPPGPTAVTGSGIVNIITQAVNYIMIVSVVIGIGMFVYGGIKYALGDPKAKDILKNAAVGLLAILGVGLLVSTIAGWIGRGLNLG